MGDWQFSPDALVKARTVAGMTQAELAEAMGEKQYNISRWELGTCKPNAAHVKGMAEALRARGAKVTMDSFMVPAKALAGARRP